MSPIRSLLYAALFSTAALLSTCATHSAATSPATTSASANALPELVPFASDGGLARLARSGNPLATSLVIPNVVLRQNCLLAYRNML